MRLHRMLIEKTYDMLGAEGNVWMEYQQKQVEIQALVVGVGEAFLLPDVKYFVSTSFVV